MFVKPGEGRRVRDPLTRLLVPETGQEWPDQDANLAVLLRHGDLVDAKAAPAEAEAPALDVPAADAAPEPTHEQEG